MKTLLFLNCTFRKHSKNIAFCCFALFLQHGLIAQNLSWAYSFKNPIVLESIIDIATNDSNRFAIIGRGNAGISMDPINQSSTFNSPGSFVAVYNEQAQIQWVNETVDNAFAVKIAPNGDVYIAGSFTGTKDFDPSGNTFLLTASGYDSYLVKLNSNGSFAWASSASADGAVNQVEILNDGRIIVAGRSDVDASVTLGNSNVVSLLKGAYILEFSAVGTLTNAYSISVPSSVGYMYVYDIASDANNNVYLGGTLDGIADFDLGANNANNPMTNAYDAYVVKYNSSFELQWFKVFGDNNNPAGWDKVRGIAIDASGNVYAGGEFTWTTDFDPSNPGNFVLTSDINTQVPSGFILQLNSSGNLNWVKKIGNTNEGGIEYSAVVSVTDIVLQNSIIYAALEGWGNWDVDPSNDTVILNVGNVANWGIGFAKYTLSGDYINAFSIDTILAGNPNGHTINDVGFGMLGNDVFVTAGDFYKVMDFDPSANTTILETDPNGSYYQYDKDLYIAKYSFGATNGLNEITSNESFLFYPNPTNNLLSIKSDNVLFDLKFTITDQLGRQVLTGKLNSEITTIDVSSFSTGLYFIQVGQESKNTFKVIKR